MNREAELRRERVEEGKKRGKREERKKEGKLMVPPCLGS